ncbi:HNH endonuclease [Deinococcus sp. RM]|uniref:HNH endonuclease n=1 Tax=Deinococcus sp. RM TaxID=2316359 RepID=UPI000E67C150|nr:hypothetical protein [Deinococcus sp. RM]RIY14526.1 hypothetical protein D3W47_04685 [Deinococcus sp. RM]
MNERTCTTCGTPFTPTGIDNRHAVCRSCHSAAAHAKYHADPRARDLQIARSMNASLSHRAPGQTPVPATLMADLILSGTHCTYCRQPNARGGAGFHLDHRVRTHSLENLALCCEMCNRAKWHHSEEVFMAWLRGAAERLRSDS